jgi:hypothetical protein
MTRYTRSLAFATLTVRLVEDIAARRPSRDMDGYGWMVVHPTRWAREVDHPSMSFGARRLRSGLR